MKFSKWYRFTAIKSTEENRGKKAANDNTISRWEWGADTAINLVNPWQNYIRVKTMKGIPLFTHFRLSDDVLFSSLPSEGKRCNKRFFSRLVCFFCFCKSFSKNVRVFFLLKSFLQSALNNTRTNNNDKQKKVCLNFFFSITLSHSLVLFKISSPGEHWKETRCRRRRWRENSWAKQQMKHMQLNSFMFAMQISTRMRIFFGYCQRCWNWIGQISFAEWLLAVVASIFVKGPRRRKWMGVRVYRS